VAKLILEENSGVMPVEVRIHQKDGIRMVKWDPVFRMYGEEEWRGLVDQWEADGTTRAQAIDENLIGWNQLSGEGGNVEFSEENKAAVLKQQAYMLKAWEAFMALHSPAIRMRVARGN